MLGTFLSKQRLATNGKFSANRRREEGRNVARKGEWGRERCICASTCADACGGQGLMLRCLPQHFSPLLLEIESLTDLRAYLRRPGHPKRPWDPPVSAFSAGITKSHIPGFLRGYWGSRLKSSCMGSKHCSQSHLSSPENRICERKMNKKR